MWLLRSRARWQNIPVDLPFGSTCWRRLQKTKFDKGMKLEIVVDASCLPLGLAAAAANVSDPLRDKPEAEAFVPIIPHRKNRVKPSRNDSRRLRRYRHRLPIEQTNAWLHCYRGLTVGWCYYSFVYVGLVYLIFIHMALKRF